MLDNIELFIKLVDIGSFSKLAKLLDLTQATVSRRIQNLESNLGVTILKRNQHCLEVTTQGQNLYDQFKDSMTELQKSWQIVLDKFQDETKGTLRLVISCEAVKDIIFQHLPEFLQQYPYAKLHVISTTEEIASIKQHYDIAIGSILPNSLNYQTTLLHDFYFGFYTSPKYITKYGKPQNIAELLQHRYVGSLLFDGVEQNNLTIYHNNNDKDLIIQLMSNLYVNTTCHNMLKLANSGEYIISACSALVTKELALGELVPILPEYFCFKLSCYLIRKSGISGKLEQLFTQFIENIFVTLNYNTTSLP